MKRGRPKKVQTPEQRVDQALGRIRVKLLDNWGNAVDRFVDSFMAGLDNATNPPKAKQFRPRVVIDAEEQRALPPDTAPMPPKIAPGQRTPRRCRNCRQYGHRRDKCPNPTASDDEGPGPRVRDVPKPGLPSAPTRSENNDLIARAQSGDKEAMKEVVYRNIRLVHAVARKMSWVRGMSYEDMIQEGVIGLMHAIEKFDLSRGLALSTYATLWIRQNISRANENTGSEIRLPARLPLLASKVDRLIHKLGHAPTPAEIFELMGSPPSHTLADIRLVMNRPKIVGNIHEAQADDDRGEWLQKEAWLVDRSPGSDDKLARNEAARALNNAIRKLPERERKIVLERFMDERTLKQIGNDMDLSRERIRQLERDALRKLRVHLKRNGFRLKNLPL